MSYEEAKAELIKEEISSSFIKEPSISNDLTLQSQLNLNTMIATPDQMTLENLLELSEKEKLEADKEADKEAEASEEEETVPEPNEEIENPEEEIPAPETDDSVTIPEEAAPETDESVTTPVEETYTPEVEATTPEEKNPDKPSEIDVVQENEPGSIDGLNNENQEGPPSSIEPEEVTDNNESETVEQTEEENESPNKELTEFSKLSANEYDIPKPEYNPYTFSTAPYSLVNTNESISNLDGNLSLSYTDVNMPGINGLDFSLVRSYSASNAQKHGLTTKSEPYSLDIYTYRVYVHMTKKLITDKYAAKYTLSKIVQEDRNKDGSSDYETGVVSTTHSLGTFDTLSAANTALTNYKLTQPSKSASHTTESSTNSFSSTYYYSDVYGYLGSLNKSGSATSYQKLVTAADQKTATSTCNNELPGKYNASGQWYQTGNATNPCPDSISYNQNGYSGTLSRTSTTTIKACTSPGTPNYTCTKMYQANYSGTVTKPAQYTTMYKQSYSGTVTTPMVNGYISSGWSIGTVNQRTLSKISNKWTETVESIASTGTNGIYYFDFTSLGEAEGFKQTLQNMPGQRFGSVVENGANYAIYTIYTFYYDSRRKNW